MLDLHLRIHPSPFCSGLRFVTFRKLYIDLYDLVILGIQINEPSVCAYISFLKLFHFCNHFGSNDTLLRA
jgi:hypothetical protein